MMKYSLFLGDQLTDGAGRGCLLYTPLDILLLYCVGTLIAKRTTMWRWGNSGKVTKVRTKVRREAAMSGNML